MNDQALKADAGKLKLSLVPTRILYDIAAVRAFGVAKYGGADKCDKYERRQKKTMNWKKEAENDLRSYMRRKDSLQNVQDKIVSLDDRMRSIRGGMSDATPVQGGESRAQENLINCIAEKERLVHTRAAVARLVKLVEHGLAGLSDQERRVLELFYIQRQAGHVERLMDELNIEQSRVYQIKDAALYKFTITLYGIVEF